MWVKYRTMWANGPDDEWSWMDVCASSKDVAERYFKDEEVPSIDEKNSWSDHYRGVEFEAVEKAPREVVERKLKRAREVLSHAERDVLRYEEMLRDS